MVTNRGETSCYFCDLDYYDSCSLVSQLCDYTYTGCMPTPEYCCIKDCLNYGIYNLCSTSTPLNYSIRCDLGFEADSSNRTLFSQKKYALGCSEPGSYNYSNPLYSFASYYSKCYGTIICNGIYNDPYSDCACFIFCSCCGYCVFNSGVGKCYNTSQYCFPQRESITITKPINMRDDEFASNVAKLVTCAIEGMNNHVYRRNYTYIVSSFQPTNGCCCCYTMYQRAACSLTLNHRIVKDVSVRAYYNPSFIANRSCCDEVRVLNNCCSYWDDHQYDAPEWMICYCFCALSSKYYYGTDIYSCICGSIYIPKTTKLLTLTFKKPFSYYYTCYYTSDSSSTADTTRSVITYTVPYTCVSTTGTTVTVTTTTCVCCICIPDVGNICVPSYSCSTSCYYNAFSTRLPDGYAPIAAINACISGSYMAKYACDGAEIINAYAYHGVGKDAANDKVNAEYAAYCHCGGTASDCNHVCSKVCSCDTHSIYYSCIIY